MIKINLHKLMSITHYELDKISIKMDVQFHFENINQLNQVYNVQGKLIFEPLFFYSKKELAILSFIIEDYNKKRIECVAFGDEAERIKKELQINKIYQINFVIAIDNKKFVKTSHKFKLQISIDSGIQPLKCQRYLNNNNKICVKFKQKKINRKKNTQHQLSITNWLK